jgi:alpha-D-ribose 1-methylphosphonate 5-triphosphate synthase subunit PhnH
MSSLGHEEDRTQRDLRQAATQTTRAANAIRDAQRATRRAAWRGGQPQATRQATTQTTRAANAIRDAQRAIERAVPARARPGRAARFGRMDTPGRGFRGR